MCTPAAGRSLLSKRSVKIVHHNHGVKPRWAHQKAGRKPKEASPYFDPEANFSVGRKKVYLPDFTITLLCKPTLPPTHAQFRVPLYFTKLDLRDYLYHAYNVKVRSIGTTINGPKISPRKRNPDPSALKRPLNTRQRKLQRDIDQWAKDDRVKKFMIVRLEKPFVWPLRPSEESLDKLAGQQKLVRTMRRGLTADERDEGSSPQVGMPPHVAKQTYAAQLASDLREGRLRWGQPFVGKDDRTRSVGGLEDMVARKTEEYESRA